MCHEDTRSTEYDQEPDTIPMVRAWLMALFLVVLSLGASQVFAAPSGFTYCGPDGDACDLIGVDAYLTFGAGEGACDIASGTCTGTYTALIRILPDQNFYAICRVELFSEPDPAPGVAKACYWVAAGGVAPGGGGASSPSGGTAFNPFNMPAEDGLVISAFIVSVWGAAYAWKMAKRALDAGDD